VSNPQQNNGDTDDLEALFDSIVSAGAGEATAADSPAGGVSDIENPEAGGEKVFSRIGHLTRKLHDTLHELGYDKTLEKVANTVPDTTDRLHYIATLTEQAAERVLTATEAAKPIQDKLEANSKNLSKQWQRLMDKELDVAQFKDLVMQTRGFLDDLPSQTRATNAQLMEIVMAQDFQDLTGQVIKKVVDLAQQMEGWMLELLLETTPADKKSEMDPNLLNGPVINAIGRTDVVTTQEQVDDLLESLGF
jgi:chemotaxis protein CheZ